MFGILFLLNQLTVNALHSYNDQNIWKDIKISDIIWTAKTY